MGWVPFIVAVARLIFSIWAPRRKGRLAHAKTVMNSLLLSKPQERKKTWSRFAIWENVPAKKVRTKGFDMKNRRGDDLERKGING